MPSIPGCSDSSLDFMPPADAPDVALTVLRRDDSASADSSGGSKIDVGKIVAIASIVVAVLVAGAIIWGAQWYLGKRKVNKLVNKWTARRDVLTAELADDDPTPSISGHSTSSGSSMGHAYRVPEETREGPNVPLLTRAQAPLQVPKPGTRGVREITLASTPMAHSKKGAQRPVSSQSTQSTQSVAPSSITDRQSQRTSSQVVLAYEPPRAVHEAELMLSPTETVTSLHIGMHTGHREG